MNKILPNPLLTLEDELQQAQWLCDYLSQAAMSDTCGDNSLEELTRLVNELQHLQSLHSEIINLSQLIDSLYPQSPFRRRYDQFHPKAHLNH